MATGTPNPDFDAEPWCDGGTDNPPEPEVIVVQADVSELPADPAQ
jgi:hypothetical protein